MIDPRSRFASRPPNHVSDLMTDWPLHTLEDAEVGVHRARVCACRWSAPSGGRGLGCSAAFAVGAIALAGWAGVGSGWTVAFVVLALLYAVAGLVEFEVGTVHTDCSLAALAAMLVVAPAGGDPVVRGRRRHAPGRLQRRARDPPRLARSCPLSPRSRSRRSHRRR